MSIRLQIKISHAQYLVLRNVAEGKEPTAHLRGNSQWGGHGAVWHVLVQRGLVKARRRNDCITHFELTDLGQGSMEAYREKLR